MRVLLASLGTRGDVQPLLALALALRGRGHHAELMAPPDFATWIEGHGVPFTPVGTGVAAFMERYDVATMSMRETIGAFRTLMSAELGAHFDLALERCRASDRPDVVVASGLEVAASFAARATGVAAAFVYFAPLLLPSSKHPTILLPATVLPPPLNMALHDTSSAIFERILMPPLRAAAARHGLPVPRGLAEIHAPNLLCAWDPELAPLSADSARRLRDRGYRVDTLTVTGSLPFREDGALSPELAHFLDDGNPPFYLGFGSMRDPRAEDTVRIIDDVTTALGVRAVYCGGWTNIELSRGARRLSVRAAPHAELFPRCAAIVHHGGAGTTAAAARAGVPQVVVPHFVDQPYWARAAVEAGVAGGSFHRNELSARTLGEALERCFDTATRTRAERVARAIAKRDSLGGTIAALEAAVAR